MAEPKNTSETGAAATDEAKAEAKAARRARRAAKGKGAAKGGKRGKRAVAVLAKAIWQEQVEQDQAELSPEERQARKDQVKEQWKEQKTGFLSLASRLLRRMRRGGFAVAPRTPGEGA